MNYLLDTNVFYWWNQDPDQLSKPVRARIDDPDNILFLSVVSVWEILIKIGIGEMRLDDPIADIVDRQVRTNDFRVLPVTLDHVYAIDGLPLYHKDPFDRLLIAQAIADDLTVLTADAQFHNYPVKVEW